MSGPALDLVALGEGMVEFHAGAATSLGTADTFRRAYGGDALNALVAAARLGGRCGFVSRVGDDAFGPALLGAWQREGLDTTHAPLVPGHNGLYFISLEPGGKRDFTYRRAGSAASELGPQDIDGAYFRGARAVLLSGVTQALSVSAQAATLAAAQAARAGGATVAFDPNYRPALWARRGGLSAARRAFHELAGLIDVLLPSHPDDAALLEGQARPWAQAVRDWPARIPLVAAKLGAEGALIRTPDAARHVPPFPALRIVDTTGAGDAWNGAFLYALARGLEPLTAARHAHAHAVSTLAHLGAVPPRSPVPESAPPESGPEEQAS